MIEYNFNLVSGKGSLVATYPELIQFLENIDIYNCENDSYYNFKALVAQSIENAIENNSYLTSSQSFKIEVETLNLFIIYMLALFEQIKKSNSINKYERYYFEEVTSQIYLSLSKYLKNDTDMNDIYRYIKESKMDFTKYNLGYIEKLTVRMLDEYSPDARVNGFKNYCYKLLRYPQTKDYYMANTEF